MRLDVRILLDIGVDGPSMNKKSERKLLESLEKSLLCKSMDWFLYNNSLRHERVKHSPARRLDFKLVSEKTDVTFHYVLCHCQTRWLSIEKVLVLPKQESFRGKLGVWNANRYKRIKDNLNGKSLLPYMTFVVFISQDFCRFLIPLQTKAQMIQLLYPM